MKRIIFTLFFVLFGYGVANAGAIATASAGLSARQWTMLTNTQIPGLNLTAQQFVQGAGGIFYDGIQPMWDSTALRLYMEMGEHATSNFNDCAHVSPPLPHTCWKNTWQYNESNSTFTIMSVYPQYSNGFHVNAPHSYTHVAWDDVNKVGYVRKYYSGEASNEYFRFCANSTPSYCATQGAGQWAPIASLFPNSEGSAGQTLVYQPNLNGGTLLYYSGSGNSSGCGRLFGFRETGGTGTWSTIDDGAGCKFSGPGDAYGLGAYSAVKGVTVFGGGNNGVTASTKFWRIGATGAAVAIDNSPCPISTSNGSYGGMAPDPVSGNIILIGCTVAGQLWELNPTGATGSQWTLIDGNLAGAGEICNVSNAIENCSASHVPIPISTYGVIAYWKYKNTAPETAELWIYKHTASGSDVVAPTVSITAPTAGATVSGAAVTLSATASDNIGVVGVQFKVDGVAIGAEDIAAPYSISWNSTTVLNGTHSITATARDAAGNSTTSTGVSVTVSNSGGGGEDFTTRCNAAGVLFCNGFDTAGDLGGDGAGNARGRAPADGNTNCGVNNCPTIDTTDKVSGAGSIKFTIPPGSGGNTAGVYWANPAADFSVRFGAGQTYYVQFRQKVTASFFPAILAGGNAKIHWVSTTPDLPGCSPSNLGNCFSSCMPNELVNQNNYGVAADALPRWYNGCPAPANNTFEFIEPVAIGQYKLQNARTGLGCTYDNVNAGNSFPPKGNCFPYYPDQWVTYAYKITLGALGTGLGGGRCYDASNPVTTNLRNCYYGNQIQARMGLDGQPLEAVLNWTLPVIAADQADPTNELKYGKVYFAPYTGISTIASGASMWFDELIISTQPIADPSSTPDTTIPTVAITSPIPPTSSSTTSPIAVSGTAADNVSVTSVTWTCIQCVTKGGTATSSPGTSISWVIPALDLVAGTNILNVVSHDAAGNASTAATLTITYTPSTTYWVRPTGTMSGCTASGTAPTTDAGYKSTITAGVNCMAAGNRLIIRAGTYNERLDEEAGGITYPRATSWAGASIIEAMAGETVTVLPTTANGNAVIRTASTATNYYLWFQGHNRNFVIDGTNVNNGMSNIKIQSPFVRLDSMEIKNGQTQNGGNGIIVVDPSTGVEILNNNIHNNGIVGDVNGQSYGIYAQSPNTIITGNDIHNNTGYGIQIYKSGGTPTNNTFANNRVYNNGCTTNIGGVLIQGTSHKVYNNLIYSNCGRPLEAYFSGDETGTVFYNNTLYGNINSDFALFLNNGVTARNNISSNNAGTLVGNGTGSVTADHNLCSSTCEFGSSNVTDTAANTFVNAAAGNFHLGPNAFAKDQGVSTLGSPYNVDFDGLPRTSPWDIGAYEFVASGTSPVVTIVNPTSNPTLSVTQPLFSLGGTSNLP